MRSFIDEMKHLVEHPQEWRLCSASICPARFAELSNAFPPPPEPIDFLFGMKVIVSDDVPRNEIRMISIVPDSEAKEGWKAQIERVINIAD